jgi:flagellin
VAALDIDEINNNGDANQALADLADFTASLDTALANLGADITRIDRQTEFVQRTEETVRIGLGALVDADIGRETAMLNSLTARQELAVEAIGIANSLPRILLDLFRT